MNIFSRTKSQVVPLTSSMLLSGTAASLRKVSRAAILPAALLCGSAAFAQSPVLAMEHPPQLFSSTLPAAAATSSSSSALPEDPSAHLVAEAPAPSPQVAPQNATKAGPFAPRYSMTISAGFQGRPWSAHDKFVGGLIDIVSPLSLAGDVLSAGYSDLTNGQPNYGTNGKAIGKRIGATVLRDSTETFFSESIMAPILHEDPRYYVEGPHYNVFHRTLYAITRPIITRTDSGHATLNGAVLVGYAAGSALSYTYYPEINKNFKDTAATFGGSLAGAAIGDFVSEFIDDVFHHHK